VRVATCRASARRSSGVSGDAVIACARRAGASRHVGVFDIVEINPQLDPRRAELPVGGAGAWKFFWRASPNGGVKD